MDKKKSAQKETLLKVLKYVRHYWPFLILSIAAAAVTVVLTLYVPILTGEAIDYIIDKGKVDFVHVFGTLQKNRDRHSAHSPGAVDHECEQQ